MFSGSTVRDNFAVGLLATPRTVLHGASPIDLALDVFPKLAERLDEGGWDHEAGGATRPWLLALKPPPMNPRLLIMD